MEVKCIDEHRRFDRKGNYLFSAWIYNLCINQGCQRFVELFCHLNISINLGVNKNDL